MTQRRGSRSYCTAGGQGGAGAAGDDGEEDGGGGEGVGAENNGRCVTGYNRM